MISSVPLTLEAVGSNQVIRYRQTYELYAKVMLLSQNFYADSTNCCTMSFYNIIRVVTITKPETL